MVGKTWRKVSLQPTTHASRKAAFAGKHVKRGTGEAYFSGAKTSHHSGYTEWGKGRDKIPHLYIISNNYEGKMRTSGIVNKRRYSCNKFSIVF